MAQGGSRKRRKRRAQARADGNGGAPAAARPRSETSAARSSSEPSAARSRSESPSGQTVMARGYSRSRQRDEEARAKLEPLEPGERPTAVTVGALVALALGLVNPLLYVIGVEVNGSRPAASGVFLYSAILLLVAWGMWRARYWAVLAMQTLLALALVVFGVFIIVEADSPSDVAISLAVLAAAGTLFWFLVKAMARIQMPTRPGSQSR